MPKFIVDLWLDGYETEEEANAAAKEFIDDQLNFSGSSVQIQEPTPCANCERLEDQLYHESRKAPEVEYKLGHEIEVLKKQLEMCKEKLKVLRVAVNDKQPDQGAVMFIDSILAKLEKE